MSGPVSEQWLLRRYRRHGDRAAREELVRRLAPLVRHVAGAYNAHGHGDDLRQVAFLGLTKAIDHYDPRYGVPLRSYAVPTMHGEVRRYLRDHSWAVHLARPLKERVLAVTRCSERLAAHDGRSPPPQRIADELELELEDVLEAMQAASAYSAASLEAPTAGSDGEAGAVVGDTLGYQDAGFDRAEELAVLSDLSPSLGAGERRVLYLRFVRDLTQTEIAREIGCSQMQVSRLLRRSLDRLSARAAGDDRPSAPGPARRTAFGGAPQRSMAQTNPTQEPR
jgi:RNA polymerase sigma-B factor